MRCVLCDAEGTVRTVTLDEGVILSVLCAAHELACLNAVATDDYTSLADTIASQNPEADADDVNDTARTLANIRVLGLVETDRQLISDMLESLRSLPPDSDSFDVEWAALETMRKRGMK